MTPRHRDGFGRLCAWTALFEAGEVNSGDYVKRSIKCKKVLGKYYDNYRHLVQINLDLYLGAEDFLGDRFVIRRGLLATLPRSPSPS